MYGRMGRIHPSYHLFHYCQRVGGMKVAMNHTIISYDSTDNVLGLQLRKSRGGPESELIDQFLQNGELKVPRGCRATIFREPRIESGFPDLVFVIWHVATAKRWGTARADLQAADLRLMHYIYQRSVTSEQELIGCFSRNVLKSLERLHAADMVWNQGQCWRTRSLSRTFAVKAIISVEAKIKEWDDALQQAWLNTWFASSSYVLVPRLPRSGMLLEKATSQGIGVWTSEDDIVDIQSLPLGKSPRSYASWLFNEWAWRATQDD